MNTTSLPQRAAGKPTMKAVVALAAIVLAAAAYFIFSQKTTAPDVKFMTIKGETVSTADLRGKVVLVNFWATTCTTCVHEMPKIVETYNKFAPRGFETIAVAMSYDPPNYVQNYAEQNRLPFRVALDATGGAAQSFGNIRLTPTTFLIDKRGNIVQRYLGEPDFAKLHTLVEQLLKEPV